MLLGAPAPYHDPRDYGAGGDGVHDETAPVYAAVGAGRLPESVVVVAGAYRGSATSSLHGVRDCRLWAAAQTPVSFSGGLQAGMISSSTSSRIIALTNGERIVIDGLAFTYTRA